MNEGLGTLVALLVVMLLMSLALYWVIKRMPHVEHFQLFMVQQTRTVIAVVTTFVLAYCIVNQIKVADWFPPLYGVILALYFKGDNIVLDAPDDTHDHADEEASEEDKGDH